ncbi:MAG: flagellar basal body L-ring protein FlgH [Alphaproteobacteria bacterium]|nr:flagellar basal body L-ring protein FlgH [Alphaproteobacteria bacterium]
MTLANKLIQISSTLLLCASLTACGAGERLANIGKAPETTAIANPVTQADYQPVSLPMPAPKNVVKQRNSLWASDRQTFFKDQRANDVGDIITVMIDIKDEAQLDNESERTRNSTEDASLSALLGLEASLDRVFPQAIDPTNLVEADGASRHNGSGSIEREEDVKVKLAAIVTQILPNGNMVIHGNQEVVVNFEKRILGINGVIRPEDITIDNTISYEKIAEARIAYGGEGQITDVQQPRYGQQLYDVIFPF